MQHADILRRDDMHQHSRIHMPNLNETRFESENIRREDGKRVGGTLPSDHPVRSSTPPIPVNKERVIRVAQQELSLDALDEDWFDAALALALDEVQEGVGLVEEGLGFEGVEGDDFEAAGTANAELGAEEVDRG